MGTESDYDLSLFLAGDALMTRPWSDVDDPSFLGLIDEMRAADATIVNLETVIHTFKGHAQAHSGGTYMASPPEIAGELKWAGVDMVSHANNHAFDYGSAGILETIEHVEAAGLILAGSGRDLQQARAPRYLQRGGGVALVSMAASFVPYGRASRSRPDLHGRPGLNPLALTKQRELVITPAMRAALRGFYRLRGRDAQKFERPVFGVRGRQVRLGDKPGRVKGLRALSADVDANLGAIAEAAGRARVTVASVHAHRQGKWLRDFAHKAIAEGADVVFVHGPHEVQGVELHDGKAIFYGLGDFVVQAEHVSRLPAEAYEAAGLGNEATPADVMEAWRGVSPLYRRAAFEAFAAVIGFRDGKAAEIRLLPLDLQYDAPRGKRGWPRRAAPELGRRIIGQVAGLSRKYGTRIAYDGESNCGVIDLG